MGEEKVFNVTNLQRMLAGKLYISADEEISKLQRQTAELLFEYNALVPQAEVRRDELLTQLLGKRGINCVIKPPFHCDYGFNIEVGENFFANFNCVILDDCKITIGDDVMLGPSVQIYTAAHPIDAEVRCQLLEYSKPIAIGNRVWIGGGAIINPGVTIGDNVIIGSGSVVTKSFPNDVIIAGNPARIIRSIKPEDQIYWQQLAKEYEKELRWKPAK